MYSRARRTHSLCPTTVHTARLRERAVTTMATDTDTDLLERTESADPIDSTDAARDAIEATMRTLGERITDGQAADLALYLPREIRSPLVDVDERTADLSRDEFRDRIATRADIDADDATILICAVFDALRETAAETQLENVRTQLPDEYDPFFEYASA